MSGRRGNGKVVASTDPPQPTPPQLGQHQRHPQTMFGAALIIIDNMHFLGRAPRLRSHAAAEPRGLKRKTHECHDDPSNCTISEYVVGLLAHADWQTFAFEFLVLRRLRLSRPKNGNGVNFSARKCNFRMCAGGSGQATGQNRQQVGAPLKNSYKTDRGSRGGLHCGQDIQLGCSRHFSIIRSGICKPQQTMRVDCFKAIDHG